MGVRGQSHASAFNASNLCLQTGSWAHPASCTMGTRGPFPGGKARPRRDADHSPPSSAKVEQELELYLIFPQALSWREEDSFSFSYKLNETEKN
jgi:hypothetical protein